MIYTDAELAMMCEAHKGLLITIVNRHRFRFPRDMYELDDIEQIAWVGAMIGFKTYKPEMGTRLDSWIGRAIESKITRELDYLYMQMRDIRVPKLSMDMSRGETESGEDVTLYNMITDDRYMVSDLPILREQAESLLDGRELEVFHMKLDGCNNADIARHYGVSRERIRQIGVLIENKLKKHWKI